MTTYTFPDITPSRSSWELVTNTRTFVSPLTNAVQTASRKGSFWKISMTFNNLSGSDRSVMQAFLTKLNGMEHRFLVYDHSHTRRGTGSDATLVAAANQSGTTLSCTGGDTNSGAGRTGYAKAGDYLRLNNELHIIVPSANTDDESYSTSSGNVTFTIAPPIRNTTSAGDDVVIAGNVEGIFMLTSAAGWDSSPGVVSSFTIEAVEDVLA